MTKGRTIALVCDTLHLHRTQELLEAQGFGVWHAADAKQFFSLLRDDNVPDLLIADMRMPESGHETVRGAREDPRLRRVPVIVMSGTLTAQMRQWVQDYGGVWCLERGSDSGLLELVSECLERARAFPSVAPPASAAAPVRPAWAWKAETTAHLVKGRTIAMIDDDPIVLELIKDMLEAYGYTVWRAADMMQFFSLLTGDNIPDLIITDMQMPGGGHQLIRNAREDPRLRRVPIIVMSAMMTAQTLKWVQDFEDVRCIEKGSEPSARLLELVAKCLEKSRDSQGQTRAAEAPATLPPPPVLPAWVWKAEATANLSKGRTIALIDDDPTVLDLNKELLEAHGYTVWRSVDMMQFFSLLTDDNAPDLIITDMQMPGGGHQLVRNARADPRLRRVPIIVMSGMPTVHTMKWFQDYEDVRCLEKGSDPARLLELVAKCLEKARTAAAQERAREVPNSSFFAPPAVTGTPFAAFGKASPAPPAAEPAAKPLPAQSLVRDFINLMNIHDLESMAALMTEDHAFADPLGSRGKGLKEAVASWKHWYRMMAAFHFDLRESYVREERVLLVGELSGLFRSLGPDKGCWKVPCAISVEVRGDRIASWTVFGDIEPVRQLMRKAS